MRTLSLTLLAAGTMLIAGVAVAQPAAGPRPGATWRGGMTGPAVHGPNVQMRGPNMQMGGQVRTGGGFQAHGGQMRGGRNFGFHRWGPRPGGNWRYERLRRGGHINTYWFAPQFYVGNWGAYGFYAPGADQRWVRYYDDAYLVDGGGRIIDERYGVNWNGYGEEWEEQGGIPGYRGAWRDSDEEEYAEDEAYGDEDYAERRDEAYAERREDHAEMRGGRHGGRMMPPPPGYGPHGPPPGTHVYGGGYGYGMYAYPIVIETVTTTGSSGYTEEIVEEYVETRQHRRRAHRPRPRCSCARPAPRPVVRRPAPRPAPAPRRPAPRPRPPAGERG